MDLTIKEVANLLNVSESTIRRWVAEGVLPAYSIKGHLRFSQMEIEKWITEQKQKKMIGLTSKEAEKILSSQMGTHAFSLYRALNKGGVIYDLAGETKEEIFDRSVKIIAKNLNLDASVLFELLWDREKLMPTSLNHGIGVPHTRDFLFSRPYDVVTIVFPKKPIDYGALDGKKVHTLFFLFACENKRHLHLLAKLAHFTRQKESLDFLMTKPQLSDLLEYVRRFEAQLRTMEEKAIPLSE